MERLEGRDRNSSIKISAKLNEVIDRLEELANDVADIVEKK